MKGTDRPEMAEYQVSASRQAPVKVTRLFVAWLTLVPLVAVGADEAPRPLGVQAPPGFEVTQYADDDLAHDIYSMTVDSLGRVVVSGAGYVKILVDSDQDGIADRAQTYADGPQTGAQGMYFIGRDLLCAGDGGLIRYRDRDGDDRADGPPDTFLRIQAGNEHDLHAIRKGPDGWWYLIAGNAAGVNSHYAALPTSPVKEPSAGAILRLKPDLSQGEVYADGFRNAYDFDFSTAGALFAFDSDGERVVSLPWYRPTRLFHVLPGSHQGWISNDWIRPESFFDLPPVVASFGRGSPTGVATYRHSAFPEEYHGAIFLLDWTYGRVWALPPDQRGSTWTGEPIEFLKATGQHGFAPTDVAVGPQGELYVCVGGRGTRGTVYCIRPQTHNPQSRPWPGGTGSPTNSQDKLELCLNAPQPLSSWSRRVWEPAAVSLTREPFVKAALNGQFSPAQRIRAIEILTDTFHGMDADTATRLALASDPLIRARTAWSIGRSQPERPGYRTLVPFLEDEHPLVVRSALEALAGAEPSVLTELIEPIGKQLAHPDRFVRLAAMHALMRTDEQTIHRMAEVGYAQSWRAAIPVAAALAKRDPEYNPYAVDIGLRILKSQYGQDLKIEAARLIQLGLGDLTPAAGTVPPVYDGYAAAIDLSAHEQELDGLRIELANLYPTGSAPVDWELERVLAVIQPPNGKLLGNVLDHITPETSPVDDIHRLIVASRLPVQPTPDQRQKIVDALLQLEGKIAQRNLRQDSNWDDRVLEMYRGLVERDRLLPDALLDHPEFGAPGHVQFISEMSPQGFDRAITAFVKKIASQPDYAWNADVVFLIGQSTDPAERDLIRDKFQNYSLRNAVIASLASMPEERDRPFFLEGLQSAPVDGIQMCIEALQLLSPSQDGTENAILARTLRKLGNRDDELRARDQLVELLRRNLGENHGYQFGREGEAQQAAIDAWQVSVEKRFPREFASVVGDAAGDVNSLKQRLAGISWNSGDATHGQQLFMTRGCAQCHGQRRALGPDLSGITGRFSRDDLFTAIVFPNQDVSPRYQTVQIATIDGHVRVGLIVYESVDGLVLRDANNQTYRIEASEIEAKRTLNQSLMPSGLLKDLSDQDLADLNAYLMRLSQTATAAARTPQQAD